MFTDFLFQYKKSLEIHMKPESYILKIWIYNKVHRHVTRICKKNFCFTFMFSSDSIVYLIFTIIIDSFWKFNIFINLLWIEC